MRGAEALQQAIIDHLAFELDRKIPLLRSAWNLDSLILPSMAKVVAGETADEAITSLDDGAATWAVVTVPRLLRTRPVDVDSAGRFIHMGRYSCQIGVWVRHADWNAVRALRDRMAAACRLCLLEYPSLDSRNAGDSGRRLVVGSYSEQFGVPIRIRNKSVAWAGALLLFEAEVEESLADGSTRPPLGESQALVTTAAAVGPTSPLLDEEAP